MATLDRAMIDNAAMLMRVSIEEIARIKGGNDADLFCAANVLGVMRYMVQTFGRRRTYDVFQQWADEIIEPELPR